jgi:uncharacterized Zn finger protein
MVRKMENRWWSKRWTQVLESYGWESRLQRGRAYAREGYVLEYQVKCGLIEAKVQGSRMEPYTVRIAIARLTPDEWDQVIAVMAEQALFNAKLLTGEMPAQIEDTFRQAGFSLFPRTGGDLDMRCSCPDAANPCKHIAAVYYIVGQAFDADPFLIFTLRGKGQQELQQALMEKRTALYDMENPDAIAAPSSNQADPVRLVRRFWQGDGDLGSLEYSPHKPRTYCPALKVLGNPPGWPKGLRFTEIMSDMYRHVAEVMEQRSRLEDEEK